MMHGTNDPGSRHGHVVNLAGFLERSTVNGPGTRTVIWVKGCPLRCDGCFNPEFWSFAGPDSVTIDELFERILAAEPVDGVTFSGGEPFAQAAQLALLGRRLADEGLSILTFTGFSYDQLIEKNRASWNALLAVTDLLVAGPYIPALHCNNDSLLASSNQKLVSLTGRIPVPDRSHPREKGKETEFTIQPGGEIFVTGFPGTGFVRTLASRCGGE